MNQERDQQKDRKPLTDQAAGEGKNQDPSPFKEAASKGEGINTEDPQEEARLEQERKEAMTERD
jgi:hypothetical protein